MALRIWGEGDERFIPSFVDSKIIKESNNEIIKEILHYGKSSLADGSPNLQRTTFRGDNLMITIFSWTMVYGHSGDRGTKRW